MAPATLNEAAPPTQSSQEPHFLYEVVNGEVKEVSHMGALAGYLASMLAQYLGVFAKQNRLGIVVVEVLFDLGRNAPSRRPDVAFLSSERSKGLITNDDPAAWNVVPNLAVEVVSPTNTQTEILDKIHDYFSAGVELVWVVNPRHRLIYVYESPTKVTILGENDSLQGSTVIPNFTLPLKELFGDPTIVA